MHKLCTLPIILVGDFMKKVLFLFIALIGISSAPCKVEAKNTLFTISEDSINTYILAETTNYDTDIFGYLDTVKCGNTEIPAPIPAIIRTIINIIKIATPLVLIIVGMIDMIKAVTSNDEKKIKESQSKFIKRLIPATMVFLVISIIQFVVSIIADDSASIMNCISCVISNSKSCIFIDKPDAPKPEPNDPLHGIGSGSGNTNKDTTSITSSKDITFSSEYFSEGGPMRYALFTPSTAKTNKSTPLIIWLHGSGEITSLCSSKCFLENGLPGVLKNWKLEGFNAYVLCPQTSQNAWRKDKSNVDKLVKKIIKEKNINTKKIILVGHSMGGYGVYEIANGNAKFYSALTIMSGYNTAVPLGQFTKTPIRGYIGTSDSVDNHMTGPFVNYFGKKKLFWVTATHGGVPKAAFTLDENKDKKSDLIEWMLAQSKKK